MREYQGRLPLYHFDFYRLDSINDIYDLGMDDYLFGKGLCVIEWAEKGLDIMPEDHLLIEIEYVSENERRLELKAHGQRYDKMLNDLKV
jgi:tRNA threonylcarbamoyladenosine biosynthesis protein TsaE